MSFPDLKTLFASSYHNLPYLESDDTKSFLFHFQARMRSYLSSLRLIPQETLNHWNKDDFINDVEFIVNEISEALELYFHGFPSQSYHKFKQLAEYPKLSARLMHWRVIAVDPDKPLYRTKREFDIARVSSVLPSTGFIDFIAPIELFHVSFEKRKAIGTNRFSIPGFPCIYLSSNLNTSWSEAVGDANVPFHATCFQSHRPVYVVDMVPLKFATPATADIDYLARLYNYDDPSDALVDYALIFPIITACHTKISYTSAYDGEVKFKSEYIIPQLLLQWYKDTNLTIDGVRYLSCTADAAFPTENFEKINFVIPAIDIREKGYCSSLLNNYSSTPVYSRLEKSSKPILEELEIITYELSRQKLTPLS